MTGPEQGAVVSPAWPSALTFLGTSDAPGVPRVYCSCVVCEAARRDPSKARRRSAVLVRSGGAELWVDAGPDWRVQMESLNRRSLPEFLITHAHHDHIGGIPEVADAALWSGRTPIFRAPAEVREDILRRYPWVARRLELKEVKTGFVWAGWRVEAFRVNHGANGTSHAYRFERPGWAFVYCPDAIAFGPAERERLRGLELLILGTTHREERAPMGRRSVYSIREALDVVADVVPKRTFFTHLSHTVDAPRLALPPHVEAAFDGLVVPIG